MLPSEFESMVRNEQYKDMIREAMASARVAEAQSRKTNSGARTVLRLPILPILAVVRLIGLLAHRGAHS